MSILTIEVPLQIATSLSCIRVPGTKQFPNSMHITLFYFDTEDINDFDPIIRATFKALKGVKPFTVTTNRVTSFPLSDDGVPIICSVKSQTLFKLHDKIKKTYLEDGVEFSNKFPEFKPHITLSYAEDTADIPDVSGSKIGWTVSEIALWFGSTEKSIIKTSIPLDVPIRIATRFRSSFGVLGLQQGKR